MENTRLKALNGPQEAPTLREELHEIKDLLRDILAELKAINGSDVDEEKTKDDFWRDMRHFDSQPYITSPYNDFKTMFPTYFTDNPSEADR